MRRKIVKSILNRFYRPFVLRHLAKETSYTWNGIKVDILPGVFHPGLFHSTKTLLEVLQKEDLKHKSLLELGAGSGLISMHAAKQGAMVIATDINAKAIDCIRSNAGANSVSINTILSDLFENITAQTFDYIMINPPYYKGTPTDPASHAWYAGAHLEYFERLFDGLSSYTTDDSKTLMVLSEDAALSEIMQIAYNHGFKIIEFFRKRVLFEDQIVFEVNKYSPPEKEG